MKLIKMNLSECLVKIGIGCELDDRTGTPCGELEIDLEYASRFKSECLELIKENDKQVILCLENVPYIDSEGLWAIFEIYKKLTAQSKVLVISSPNSNVMRVLKIIKLDSRIKIFDTDEQAIKYLEEIKNF